MYSDLPTLEAQDEEEVFLQWVAFQREPTLFYPADFVAERGEVARLRTRIQTLQSMASGPGRDKDLAIARKFYELSCWRLFPFNSLPDDLILQVFQQGTFCSPDNKCGPIMPLLYSKICKRWRELALDASWLWGFIGFNDDRPYILTQMFLERSRFSPLIIEIDMSDRKFDYEDDLYWPRAETMMERLSVLTPHVHRWKTFYCCTDNWAPMEGAISVLRHLTAPILKRIELKQNFENQNPEKRPFLPLFGQGAPALEGLVLNTVPIDWHDLPFSNLTELELHRLATDVMPTVQAFWSMLHHSPNLRKLSLIGAGPQWDEEVAQALPVIELLYLEELELEGAREGPCTLEYALFVLNMIFAGSTLLSLDLGEFPNESDWNLVVPVLHNRFRQVERLLIAHMSMDAPTVARWLDAMPNLKYISLYGHQLQTAVFEALATPAREFALETSGDVLCPSLKILAPFTVTPTIHDLLSKRQELGAPITTLMWDLNLKDEALKKLGSLRDVIEFDYEGELFDSDDEWVGPDPGDWSMNSP